MYNPSIATKSYLDTLSRDEALMDLQFAIEGTCESLAAIIIQHDLDIDVDELEDRLLDGHHPIERCGCCGWWFEVCMLEYDPEIQAGTCADCNPDIHDANA